MRAGGRSGARELGGGNREAGGGKREAGSGKREAGSGKREAGSGKRGTARSVIPSAARNLLLRLLAAVSLYSLPAFLFALPAAAQTHLVIVSGLGGERKYAEGFAGLAATLAEAANKRFGIKESDVQWFGEDSVSARPFYRGQATKANVESGLAQVAARSRPDDQIVLVLVGHGSGEGEATKLSMPGPDMSARDFAAVLGRFPTQKVAFVNLSSASGDMLPVLSAPNRVIITATKSAFERNESHFGAFFVDALVKDVADTDKDHRVSLLEAFQYAVAETKRMYENDSRLQTEHPQFDDVGAKAGVPDPDGRTGQGLLARRFFLGVAGGSASNDPLLAALYREKFGLEDQIGQLRLKKAGMSPDAYDDALEELLVQLARKAKAIREIEGRKS